MRRVVSQLSSGGYLSLHSSLGRIVKQKFGVQATRPSGVAQRKARENSPVTVERPRKILRSGFLVAASAFLALGVSRMTSSTTQSPSGGWWVPSSDEHLEEAEHKVLSAVKADLEMSFVELDNGYRVRTLIANRGKFPDKAPLVLVHGFAAAIGTWAKNIDELAEKRTVYALDQVGFGRSDRPDFSTDAVEAEEEFVTNLEQWRDKMSLDSFILLGHSLGGFISLSYALKHPQHIKHLILADPWGFAVRPEEGTEFERLYPIRYKLVSFIGTRFNPLGLLRAAGPLGPGLLQRIRPDLQRVFADMYPDSTMMDYMYHCNAQKASGETAMKTLMGGKLGFAANPMLSRIGNVPDSLSILFIYGGRSWNGSEPGEKARELLGKHRVNVQVLDDANHHVYGFYGFNQLVNEQCHRVDRA